MRFFRENESLRIVPEVAASATMGAAIHSILFGELDYRTVYQSIICGILASLLTAYIAAICNPLIDIAERQRHTR